MRKGMLSLLGAAATLGAFAVGCGGDDTTTTITSPSVFSRVGESCARTGDCEPGLYCIANRCVQNADASIPSPGSGGAPPVTPTGGSGGTGGSEGGVTPLPEAGVGGSVTPGAGGTSQPQTTPVVLSGEYQSCARTADCSTGLVCIALMCMKAGTPIDAGIDAPVATPPRLGGRGESCQVAADCEVGLICVAAPYSGYPIVGSICEVENYGLTPSAKVCGGECETAADCCELPPGIDSASANPLRSCADVLKALGSDAGPCPIAGNEKACFFLDTYCNCAADTWQCSSSKQCLYKPTGTQCTATTAVNTPGGCPSMTRLQRTEYNYTCSAAGKCAPAVNCANDSDCVDKPVVGEPSTTGDTCAANECKCYQNGCYRKCAKALDCASNYTCSTDTNTANLCVPMKCTSDLECVRWTSAPTAKCNVASGACTVGCTSDYDYNRSGYGPAKDGYMGSYVEAVCVSGECKPLGCNTNNDCWGQGSQLKTFCMTPPTTVPTVSIQSAITTGK